jgi:Flp pilus assembly protein TadD
MVLLDRGDIHESTSELEHVLLADPNDARAHTEMGRALALRGDLGAALQSLDRAAALDPGSPGIHALRTAVLLRLERRDDASRAH